MSGEKGLSVYYPLPLSLVPALPFISSSFWGEGPLGYGGLSGGGGTFSLWKPVGILLLTCRPVQRLVGRPYWQTPHDQSVLSIMRIFNYLPSELFHLLNLLEYVKNVGVCLTSQCALILAFRCSISYYYTTYTPKLNQTEVTCICWGIFLP